MTEDFMNATAGHSVILNFSTIPQWMFKTEKPVAYPAHNEVCGRGSGRDFAQHLPSGECAGIFRILP
jgi:hypothetical protein